MITIYNSNTKKFISSEGLKCINNHGPFPNFSSESYTRYYLKLLRKINQSKYIFRCTICKEVFVVIIKPPNFLCPDCFTKPNSKMNLSCDTCNTTGILNWLEKIFGKKESSSYTLIKARMINVNKKRFCN
jgi:hypothetical protein